MEVLSLQARLSVSVDPRIDQILTALAAGKQREQIATELSYKSYKSLDLFMKRHKYRWDSQRHYYFPDTGRDASSSHKELHWLHKPDSRTASVLSLLQQGLDLKAIADQLRFPDHRELALYMKSKGYIWNEPERTYHFRGLTAIPAHTQPKDTSLSEPSATSPHQVNQPDHDSLMEYLEQHKGILLQLISSHSQGIQLPRYTIPGVYITKSISMNYGMDMLVRSYSQDKNVSQKDIVEIALIDFFSKYAYTDEIQALLGRRF